MSAYSSSTSDGAASTYMTASASKIVPTISLVFMCVCDLKGLKFGEEIVYLGLHRGVSLIGGCEFGCVLGVGGCAFVLVDLEARHHLIYNGVVVVEAQFINHSTGFSEFNVSFSEVVLEIIPCFLRLVGVFPGPDAVFEYPLSVEENEGEVYCMALD